MYYFKNLIKTLDFIKIKTIIFLNNKTFIKIIKIKMDDIKKILLEKKQEINISLDSFMNDVKKNIENKNEKIKETSNRSRIVLFFDFDSIKEVRKNNKLLKKSLKIILDLKKQNKKLKKTINNNSDKNSINTKDMTAFKLIAIELEEKEKELTKYLETIKEKENTIKILEQNIFDLNNKIDNMEKNIENIKIENQEFSKINEIQTKTINVLELDVKNKNKAIGDLKESFIKLLDKYNDILIEVY